MFRFVFFFLKPWTNELKYFAVFFFKEMKNNNKSVIIFFRGIQIPVMWHMPRTPTAERKINSKNEKKKTKIKLELIQLSTG